MVCTPMTLSYNNIHASFGTLSGSILDFPVHIYILLRKLPKALVDLINTSLSSNTSSPMSTTGRPDVSPLENLA